MPDELDLRKRLQAACRSPSLLKRKSGGSRNYSPKTRSLCRPRNLSPHPVACHFRRTLIKSLLHPLKRRESPCSDRCFADAMTPTRYAGA